jgi:hypothetical protein
MGDGGRGSDSKKEKSNPEKKKDSNICIKHTISST